MRLGLVIYGGLETPSGGFLYDRKLHEALQARGHEVEIISLPWRSYTAHLLDNLSPSIRARLQNGRFDLLLQDELNHPSLFALNRRLDQPIISIVHHLRSSEAHLAPLRALYRAIERRYLRSVDGFIFNSETTRRVVQSLSGKNKPGVVAQPGSDQLGPPLGEKEIRARAAHQGPLRIVFVGSLIHRKRLDVLLSAMGQLAPGSVELQVVGSLDAEPRTARAGMRLAADLGLEQSVHFHGHLDKTALADVLRGSDVLALPSSYEGFGIAYVEGMGFGLPAIGARAGAAPELIRHGVNGFLVGVGEVGEVADCLRSLAADRARLLDMSLAARRRYAEFPTWAQSTARATNFLEGTIMNALHRPRSGG